MDVLECITSRRSTRKYQEKQVSRNELEQVLEAGRYAPSGGNHQTTHFIVIQDKGILGQLSRLVQQEFAKMEVLPDTYSSMAASINASKKGNYVFHYHAPTLIVTANQADYGNNIADCACALENMMIMANALDLGSCWINQLRWLNENQVISHFIQSFGLQKTERIYGALSLGYADSESGLPSRVPLPRTGNPVDFII